MLVSYRLARTHFRGVRVAEVACYVVQEVQHHFSLVVLVLGVTSSVFEICLFAGLVLAVETTFMMVGIFKSGVMQQL